MRLQRRHLILVTSFFRLLARLFLSLRVPQSTLFADFTASGSQEEVDILFVSENAMVFFRTWPFRRLIASVLKFLSQRYNVELLDPLYDSMFSLQSSDSRKIFIKTVSLLLFFTP